jgi:hypothetical protein
MKAKSFKYWTTQELHIQFGISKKATSPLFDEWLASDEPISADEGKTLETLRLDLLENADYWNEEELKIKFIGQVVELANLRGNGFRTFYDRPISAIVNGTKLFGKLDMFVASGFQNPIQPFFCVHEYKQENNRDGDPKGQLLAEMLAVQALNKNDKPIYGCYVLGRNWFFVLLQNQYYAISDAFVASQKDIMQIFKLLKKVKQYIESGQL